MNESPQFRTVMRGYDPDEVMSVVTELTSSLGIARRTAADRTMELSRVQARVATLEAHVGELTEKLAAAPQEPGAAPDAFAGVGTRLTAILELAEEEAGQIRAEGERAAEALRTSAEAARREADRASQHARDTTLTAERVRADAVTQLHGVLEVLASIEAELADDAPPEEGVGQR